MIVTTYPAFSQAAVRAAKNAEPPAPVDVVVTDLINVHNLWFHASAALTFVATGTAAIARFLDHSGLPLQIAVVAVEIPKLKQP